MSKCFRKNDFLPPIPLMIVLSLLLPLISFVSIIGHALPPETSNHSKSDSTNVAVESFALDSSRQQDSSENSPRMGETTLLLASDQLKAIQRFKRRTDRRQQANGPGPAGKANQTAAPEFAAPIGNVTSVLGRDVRLVCTVDNLGPYQVAWLKEETKTILSIDTNIIITNYRIFLIPDEEERKWVLHIKDVQESDRGFYQCQINTKPTRSTSGYLEVVVPPQIVESQTSQVAEVIEHSNVSIQCKANGHPKPTIAWRRDDGTPIRLLGDSQAEKYQTGGDAVTLDTSQAATISRLNEIKSDRLTLNNVDRSMGGQYVCTASNGIPSQVSKTIPVYVKFPPRVSTPSKFVSASLGDQLELDCLIESFPRATSYWSKQQNQRPRLTRIFPHKDRLLVANDSLQNNGRGARLIWQRAPRSVHSATLRVHNPILELARSLEDGTTTANQSDLSKELRSPETSSPEVEREELALMEHEELARNEEEEEEEQQQQQQLKRISVSPSQTIDFGDIIVGNKNLNRLGGAVTAVVPNKKSLSNRFVFPITTSTATITDSSDKTQNNGQLPSVTVKQTPLNNPYTYRLRLSIASVQSNHFGEYVCNSANLLGTSEIRVIVTMADKPARDIDEKEQSHQRSRSSNLFETPYDKIQGSLSSYVQAGQQNKQSQSIQRLPVGSQWSSSSPSGQSGGRIYDENYLQAIKSRQAENFASSSGAGKLKQTYNHLRGITEKRNAARIGGNYRYSAILVIMSIGVSLRLLSLAETSWP